MSDILGKALLDYHHGSYTGDIRTETDISEEDILPLPYLFRSYDEMPTIEQKALQLTKGKTLDVGCGSGCHSLYLQKNDVDVTAIDISEGAIKVCQLQGLQNSKCIDLLNISEKYDTILLLMNGTGIFQKMELVPQYLSHLRSLLYLGGQILIDSCDLKYMYDTSEDGSILVPAGRYYGELNFTVHYKGETSTPFPWLYIDKVRFANLCHESQLNFELIEEDENHQYLARLTDLVNTPG